MVQPKEVLINEDIGHQSRGDNNLQQERRIHIVIVFFHRNRNIFFVSVALFLDLVYAFQLGRGIDDGVL